jgi:geranylgeranyl pyrophosphate synthase
MMSIFDPKEDIFETSSLDTTSFAAASLKVKAYISSAQPYLNWADCQQTLCDLLAADESWIHALPVVACVAVGGKADDAVPVAAAWTSLRHAANLMDDVQDGDLHRYAHPVRPDIATTYALALIFSAFQILNEYSPSQEKNQKIVSIFARSGLDSSRGQLSDLISKEGEAQSTDMLQAYWMSVIQKSGSIYYAGLAGAAAAGTDSDDLIEALGQYGIALGVIRQVIDDCRDILIDAKDTRKASTLPELLLSILSRTESGQQSASIPEVIGDILEEWKRRALESLEILDPSLAKDSLVTILDLVLQPRSLNS